MPATVGAVIAACPGAGSPVVVTGSARLSAAPASGSSKTEETARTRVSAPSSRRTLPGTRVAIVRRTSGSGSWSTASLAKLHSSATRVRRSGGSDLDGEPPLEAVAEALLEPLERARRAVAREHDLLAGGEQRVEGVDELLLGARLALEDLDVVDQEGIEPAIALLEPLGPLRAKRGDELAREPLGGRVVNGQLRVVVAVVARDRAQQVGLAEAGRPVEEERVVRLAGQLGHGERGGVGEAVARADDEPVEVVGGVDRHRLGDGPFRLLHAGRGLGRHEHDPLEPGGQAPERALELVEVAALDPGPHPARRGQVEGLGAGPGRSQRLEPEVEGGRGQRRLQLRPDALPDCSRVVVGRSLPHPADHIGGPPAPLRAPRKSREKGGPGPLLYTGRRPRPGPPS